MIYDSAIKIDLNMDLDTNTNINQYVKLCIPYISKNTNIDINYMKQKMDSLNIGIVGRIDIIKNQKYNTIFIWFYKWHTSELAKNILQKLQNGNEINVVYEFPWFWKVRLCYY